MVLISGKNRAIYLLSLLTKRKEKINIYRPGLADMIRGMTIIPRSMSARTLFDKVWDAHTVNILPSGQTQLFIGLHLVHEVTSPQAFSMLRERGLKVLFPGRTIATVDHIVPTENQARPFLDDLAEEMILAIETNVQTNNIPFYGIGSGNQGIVHVIAPEQGLTQPGMTIACGDSHTSTHGAFGAIAFGIGMFLLPKPYPYRN